MNTYTVIFFKPNGCGKESKFKFDGEASARRFADSVMDDMKRNGARGCWYQIKSSNGKNFFGR